jgi:hypothetical protein
MNNKELSIYIVFIFFAFFSHLQTNAQQSYIKNRWCFDMGYSNDRQGSQNNRSLVIHMTHGMTNHLEAGLYSGYGVDYSEMWHYSNSLYYGITLRYHLLPYIIKSNDFRLDVYMAGKYGGFYYISKIFPDRKNYFGKEFGIGAGVSLYPWKHFGFFCEYIAGNIYLTSNHQWKFGVKVKFKNDKE